MKILFCHDGPLRKDEFNNYYGIAHNDKTFRRYYTIGNELTVVIRVNEVSKSEAEQKYSKITVAPFEVIKCPNLASLNGILFKRQEAKRIIEDEVIKADAIIARLPSLISFLAIDYAKKMKKPYMVESVGCAWDAHWNHSFKGKLIAPFMYYKTKSRIKNAPYVVYVTNEFLQNRYPTCGKSVCCSNVALTEFDGSVLDRRLEKIESMKSTDRIIIGTTAAVNVRYKGQQYIIKALGKLKKEGITNFEYQLVGGGDQTYLKAIAKKYDVVDQVKFLGSMPHNKVFDWLDTIDIYIQPSRQEGLPRALIEAMSRGLPCLGARTGGIPELLEPSFVFSKSRKETDEIINNLLSMTPETMKVQALRNFEKAKEYEKDIIEQRRREFFEDFKNSAVTNSKA